MTYSQYLRIETRAGGASATPRQFIRAAHAVLTAKGRSRGSRDVRHAWLRQGLAHLTSVKEMRAHWGV